MAQDDKPWWGKNHTLWGGETFRSTQTKPILGIVTGDRFRVERGSNNKSTLIPHPANQGTWKNTHDKSNPVKLTLFTGTPNEKAYSMMVTIVPNTTPQQLFFIERVNGTTAITNNANNPPSNGGTASVER